MNFLILYYIYSLLVIFITRKRFLDDVEDLFKKHKFTWLLLVYLSALPLILAINIILIFVFLISKLIDYISNIEEIKIKFKE